MNNPLLLSCLPTLRLFFSAIAAAALLVGCNEPVTTPVESEAVRAPSGGQYQRYTWRNMEAELLHPSAQPEGENIYLMLPLPELSLSTPNSKPLASVHVELGRHSLHPAVQAENEKNNFHFVVQNGVAVPDGAASMHFFVVLEFTGDHDGQLFITQKQYSLRQVGEDMAHFGVKNAVAIPLTTRVGWYRYANAPFELRKDRLEAAELFVLKEIAQN